MPTVRPPIIFSGYNYSDFKPTLGYLWDNSISGFRAITPTDFNSVNVTGSIAIDDYIQLSGTNLVSLTGTNIVTRTPGDSGIFVSGRFIPTSAISGFQSGTSGTPAGFIFAAETNALIVQPPNLDKTFDSVLSYPPRAASLNTAGIQGAITAMGTVFPANPNRNLFFIQNQNTGLPLLLSLSGAASITNWNISLKPASSIDFGDGGSFTTDSFLGAISVTGSGNIRYTSFEF